MLLEETALLGLVDVTGQAGVGNPLQQAVILVVDFLGCLLFKLVLNGLVTRLVHLQKVGGRLHVCQGLTSLDTQAVSLGNEIKPIDKAEVLLLVSLKLNHLAVSHCLPCSLVELMAQVHHVRVL